jgi:hypothetical protein
VLAGFPEELDIRVTSHSKVSRATWPISPASRIFETATLAVTVGSAGSGTTQRVTAQGGAPIMVEFSSNTTIFDPVCRYWNGTAWSTIGVATGRGANNAIVCTSQHLDGEFVVTNGDFVPVNVLQSTMFVTGLTVATFDTNLQTAFKETVSQACGVGIANIEIRLVKGATRSGRRLLQTSGLDIEFYIQYGNLNAAQLITSLTASVEDTSSAGFGNKLQSNAALKGVTIVVTTKVVVQPYTTTSVPVTVECPNACNNQGTCQLDGSCKCNSGFTGADCSGLLCPNNCTNHGQCKKTTTWPAQTYCQCDAFWLGTDCSEATRGLKSVYVWPYNPTTTQKAR